MFRVLRKLFILVLAFVAILPARAVDKVTIVTDDYSSMDTLLYSCQRFAKSGTYTNVPYGDGERTLVYTIYQHSSNDDVEATITLGDTLIFGCRQIAPEVAGDAVYFDTVPEDGYERILKLTLRTLALECDTQRYAYSQSITEGDTLIFGCQLLYEEGTYYNRLSGAASNGCDSIITLILSVLPAECDTQRFAYEQSIIEGDTLIFGCQLLAKSGTYRERLAGAAANGCDSIVTLTLSVVPAECDTQRFAYNQSIIEGDTLIFGCQLLYEEGTYYNRLAGAASNGCDSIVTLTLTLTPAECDTAFDTVRISIYEGDTLLFFCQQLTDEGEYREVIRKADNSCDSIITLELSYLQDYDSVRAYIYDTIYNKVCLGSTFDNGSLNFIVNADTTVNDTIVDYLPMQVDEIEHQHIYTDSIATYIISVLLPSDTTLQDSIELGQSYTFKGEELTPTEAGVLELLDTVPNMHGCDSVITIELRVIAVEELHEFVQGAVQDTLCLGAEYIAGSQTIVISQDTVVTDTVFAIQQAKDDILHTLTYTDSVTTYTVLAWHDELSLAEELDWGHAFCGTAYSGAEQVLGALREAVEQDDLFNKDTTLAFLYKNEAGEYVPYAGVEMSPSWTELSLRAELSNACGKLTYDKVLPIEKPDYDLSDEFADLPAVSKYNDWLLLVDVDSLNKVYGLYPEADSVRWFKITGAEPDIDNDELVGTGYYYTDDRHLVGYYYAIVTLPVQTDECGGEWRTRIVVRTNNGAPLSIAPNIVRVGTPVNLYHLLTDEVSTLYIYAADGQCVQTITHRPSAGNKDGKATVATRNLAPGVYTIRVVNSSQKAALRFIITQ